MGKFITELEVKQVREGLWELTEPLIYESSKLGLIVVDAGTRTDFASVPRLPVAYLLAGGRANASATLHDSLYAQHNTGRCRGVSRLEADNLIFEATLDSLPDEGYSIKSLVMRRFVYLLAAAQWISVRVFGAWYWDGSK